MKGMLGTSISVRRERPGAAARGQPAGALSEASMVYTADSRPAKATDTEKPSLKNSKQRKAEV